MIVNLFIYFNPKYSLFCPTLTMTFFIELPTQNFNCFINLNTFSCTKCLKKKHALLLYDNRINN